MLCKTHRILARCSIQVLKREVVRTQEAGMEKGTQYRTLLIQAIHGCATKFADVAERYVRTRSMYAYL